MNVYVLQVSAHKKEIKTRDVSIGEKEKRIYELKKKNQVGKNTAFTPPLDTILTIAFSLSGVLVGIG